MTAVKYKITKYLNLLGSFNCTGTAEQIKMEKLSLKEIFVLKKSKYLYQD